APTQARWRILRPAEFTSSGGASFKKMENQFLLVTPNLNNETYTIVVRTELKTISAFQLEVMPSTAISTSGPGPSRGADLVTSFRVQTGVNGSNVIGLQRPQSSVAGQYYWVIPEALTSLQEGNQLTLILTLQHPDK